MQPKSTLCDAIIATQVGGLRMSDKEGYHKSRSDDNDHKTIHRPDGSVAAHEYRDGAKKSFPPKD